VRPHLGVVGAHSPAVTLAAQPRQLPLGDVRVGAPCPQERAANDFLPTNFSRSSTAVNARIRPATVPAAATSGTARYPSDPPTVEEIVAAMRAAGDTTHGWRPRGLIVVLWRAGLRISEALALGEADLDSRRGSVLVRRGKGGRRARSAWTTGPGNSCSRG
jgi:integrase